MNGFGGFALQEQDLSCYSYNASFLGYTPFYTTTASQFCLESYKIPKICKKGKNFHCPTCQKTINGAKQYASHILGKLHKKNLIKASPNSKNMALLKDSVTFTSPLANIYNTPVKSFKSGNPLPPGHLRCTLCGVVCNSRESFRVHVAGMKHKKNLNGTTDKNATIVSNIENSTNENPNKDISVLTPLNKEKMYKIQISEKPSGQISGGKDPNFKDYLGHEFVTTIRNGKAAITNYKCSLCSCKITDANGVVSHLAGRKHRQQYKSQVNSKIVVRPKSLKRAEKKKQEKEEKKKAKEEFWKKKDEHLEPKCKKSMSDDLKESSQSPQSSDDENLLAKYEMVRKDPKELKLLLWFCEVCENALKLVSDEFLIKDGYTTNDDRRRLLRGTMRVGVLCSMQLIKEDRDFRMVLLLSMKPTRSLLERIHRAFLSHLKEAIQLQGRDQPIVYKVVMVPDAACLMIYVASPLQFNICISVTSQLFDEEAIVIVKEEGDVLCPDSCKESLQQLKRADWFQARAKCLNEGLKVLTVLRHLRLESDIWSTISEWANELLIEKCTFVQGLNAPPSDIMRCYLELLSSGLLFDGPGLLDPCENTPVDLLKDINSQERENITLHAQKCLRHLAFKQSYIFLNIPQICPKKRKFSSDDDLSPEIKKKPI